MINGILERTPNEIRFKVDMNQMLSQNFNEMPDIDVEAFIESR